MKLPFDFSIKLIFRLVFPGVILAAAFVPGLHGLLHLLALNIKFEYLFPIEIVAWGWVIVVSDMTIYMLFEGRRYWPSPIRKLLIRFQKRRLTRLTKIVLKPPPPNADRRKFLEASVEYALYPVNERSEAYVEHPTRLGNIIESYETYPRIKYGLNAVFYWYRLWIVLDKDLREEIDSAQAMVDSTIYICFALYVSGLVMLIYAALTTTFARLQSLSAAKLPYIDVRLQGLSAVKLPYLPAPGILCLLGAGCFFLGFVVYRLSLRSHAQFGELFKSVFDQYRSKIVFDDILDDIARTMGDPTMTLRLSQRDKNRIIWRFLRWHLIRDESTGRNLTLKEWHDRLNA